MIWQDGFDWAASIAQLASLYTFNGNPSSISTSGGRNGRGCWTIGNSSGMKRALGSTYTTIVGGVAVRPTSLNVTVHQLQNAGGTAILSLTADSGSGLLSVRFGAYDAAVAYTSTKIVFDGTWHYVEYKLVIDGTAGSIDVYIDGDLDISESGIDTDVSGAAAFALLGNYGSGATGGQYDDWYLHESTVLGDMEIRSIAVGDDQATMDMVNVTGGGGMYAELDEANADGDTSYGTLSADGERSEFGVVDPALSGVSVFAVSVIAVARQESPGSHGLKVGVGTVASGATDGAKKSLQTTYTGVDGPILETNPDTASAWLPSEVANVLVAVEYAA